jgi:cyclase family protein
MKVIDLTHTIKENMPVYPGDDTPKLIPVSTYEKDGFKETLLQMYSHTGTHMDTPAHIFAGRTALDEFPIEQFIGKALVIDCRDLVEGQVISMKRIAKMGEKVKKADFLLFNLGWDKRWGTDSYFGDYPCINDEVLDFIINGDYKGIGFDVMGLDPIYDVNLPRHKRLFQDTDIINIENLKNLDLCGSDLFYFSCFPLKIENCDGSPIRAVAWFE